ncbi:MAG: glycoside hydrolase family 113, partial [Coprococcus sp.]
MEYIKGFTFSPFSKRGSLTGEDVYRSLDAMKERTNANFVIFAPNGLQQTAQSENISF